MTPRFRVFISSPGDVKAQREVAALAVERLSQDYASVIQIESYLWEFEAMLASGHFQDSIEPPSAFDVVVLIVWSRLGTPMPERTALRTYRGMDGRAPVTGTEWEFEDALQSARTAGSPDLLVYRSGKPALFDTQDPARFQQQAQQLTALNSFWERHFSNQGVFHAAYSSFSTDGELSRSLESHLRSLIDRRLEQLAGEDAQPGRRAWSQNPFRGLQPYEFEYAPVFFGQDEAIAKAMMQLVANQAARGPFLIVLGSSGSGKSSLVRAGLLPRLFVPRRIEGLAFLRFVLFRPSDVAEHEDLFDALARCLITRHSDHEGLPELLATDQLVADLAAHLRSASPSPAYPIASTLAQLAVTARQTGHMLEHERPQLIIVLDQLEELLTVERIAAVDRPRFISLLAGLVQSGSVWVIATMRKDFWHRADELPQLVELAEGAGRLELLPPNQAQISRIIRGTAAAAGLSYETHVETGVELSDVIAEEVAHEPGALPLLSYLLDQLYRFDIAGGRGRMLTYASYVQAGKLHGAIATTAEMLLARCSAEVQSALSSVLYALVSMSGGGEESEQPVSRRVPLSGFVPGSSRRALVDAFLDPAARLLVADTASDGTPLIRVAHEALIQHWDRARQYVSENAEALRLRRRTEDRYKRWRNARDLESKDSRGSVWRTLRSFARPESGLLEGVDLADGQRLLQSHRQDSDHGLVRYIERSVASARRKRNRTIQILALVGTTFAVLAAIAYTQRDAARMERDIADRVTQFMVAMIGYSDPSKSRGATVTVKEILNEGAKTIDSEPDLRSVPRVRSELRTAMGQAFGGLGLYDRAEQMLAGARQDQAGGASIPAEDRVRTLIASGDTANSADRAEDAIRYLEQAVALARRSLPSANVWRSRALVTLADALTAKEDYDHALELCLEALQADRRRPMTPENEAELANTLDTENKVYFQQGNLSAASRAMHEALDLREKAFGWNHPATARSLNDLGAFEYQSGLYAKAVDTWRRALPIYEHVYSPEHPEVGVLRGNLARPYLMLNDLANAEPLARSALAILEKFEGPRHSDLVSPLNSLAMIDAKRGHLEAARSEIGRAESIALQQEHFFFVEQVLLTAAWVEVLARNIVPASDLLSQSTKELEYLHPDKSAEAWRYAICDAVKARLLALQGHQAEGVALAQEAQAVIDRRFGPASYFGSLEPLSKTVFR